MSPVLRSGPDALMVLHGISWATYTALLEDLAEQPGHRFAYDRGTLEIMSPSDLHEKLKTLLARMIEVMMLELNIDSCSLGATTWNREDLGRGIEADECYYIASESRVRGKSPIVPGVDPPPDLAIEVEISRPAIDKLAIYAALGVNEIWKHDGQKLRVFVLEPDGRYRETRQSLAFPFLPLHELERFLAEIPTSSEVKLVRDFRDWVRSELGPHARS